jgi:predicted nucleic acid-binding protein
MKILIDTDILLDVALRREKFFDESAAVLSFAESKPRQSAVAWHSLSNISYLLRPDARAFIKELLAFVTVPSTGTYAALQAIGFPMKDFEDAMQAATAVQFGASHIVTRNAAHYQNSPVPAISPRQFMVRIQKDL